MNIINRIQNRLRTDFFRSLYRHNVSAALQSAPLVQGERPLMVLSMVHRKDVLCYLVAIKSFAKYTNPQRVVVVCDPTIGEEERAIFKSHIPHVELRDAIEFRDPRIPQGGCWERLSAITTYSPENYVVQLDADTVTTGQVPEVLAAISNKSGFVIGTEYVQKIMTLAETAGNVVNEPPTHVQTISELRMKDAGLDNNFYVRGCAGFTGFPSDQDLRTKFFEFAVKMAKITDSWWPRWGSEQVASNYLIANANNSVILPFPKYATPVEANNETVFQHFIGTVRFINRKYEKSSISALLK